MNEYVHSHLKLDFRLTVHNSHLKIADDEYVHSHLKLDFGLTVHNSHIKIADEWISSQPP